MNIEIVVFLIFATLLQQPRFTTGCETQFSEDQKTVRVFNCKNSLNIDEIHQDTTSLTIRPNSSVIKILSGNLFEHLPNLESVVMNAVNLEKIEQDTFQHTRHLKSISLERNHLLKLTNGAFNGANSLETVKLGKNNISLIDFGTFNGLRDLKLLDLSRNDLQTLENGLFDDLSSLEVIDLSYNRLESLNKHIFQSSLHIKSIKLFKNHLKTFDIQLPTDKHFCYLNVDNNSINYFSLTFTQLTDHDSDCTTHGIHASYNAINGFFVTKESTAVNLITLNGNLLENIANITQVTGLTKLDVSSNGLTNAALQDLKYARHLKALTLKHLNLVQLEILKPLNQLTELDVSNNAIEEIDFGVFADNLSDFYKLNLANNRLTSLDVVKLLEKFPNLTYLNIKGNRLTKNHLDETLFVLNNRGVTVVS